MTSYYITPKRNPNLTYPVITRMGIREVPGNVADNMEHSAMTDRERIYDLEQRVAALEDLLRNATLPYNVQGLR